MAIEQLVKRSPLLFRNSTLVVISIFQSEDKYIPPDMDEAISLYIRNCLQTCPCKKQAGDEKYYIAEMHFRSDTNTYPANIRF